jgi:hypothetical protein
MCPRPAPAHPTAGIQDGKGGAANPFGTGWVVILIVSLAGISR